MFLKIWSRIKGILKKFRSHSFPWNLIEQVLKWKMFSLISLLPKIHRVPKYSCVFSLLASAEASSRSCQCPPCTLRPCSVPWPTFDCQDMHLCIWWLFFQKRRKHSSHCMASKNIKELLWQQPSTNDAELIGVNTLVPLSLWWDKSVCVWHRFL